MNITDLFETESEFNNFVQAGICSINDSHEYFNFLHQLSDMKIPKENQLDLEETVNYMVLVGQDAAYRKGFEDCMRLFLERRLIC